ncbi:MAG: RICIN domain-containing protein [Cellvibrionaceae bacterium]|nr:RICIN domain-containing protein [Cellvibrionaceae bacterium]
MKYITTLSAVIMICLPIITYSDASATTVEVMLASHLDETRGYCLDIAGGKGENAPVEKGLQAHTCYNYTGEILVDQGFDHSLIGEGQFKIPYFDVCMSVSTIEVNSAISLAECQALSTQRFTLMDNGNLVPQANPNLCVTVSSAEKKEGRGASPVHVMRPVSLQLCDDAISAYQSWVLNKL